MTIAFIGFGEAAQSMAAGFHETGPEISLSAFDIRVNEPSARAALHAIAVPCGVTLASSADAAIAGAEIVLSLVQGSVSVAVAKAVAPHLVAGQVYVDLNSTGPHTKSEVAAAIAPSGADCLDGAVMDAVKPHRHRVPILLAGPKASEVALTLNALGMRCEAVGETIGAASAVKMIRSVMMKGVEALILEAMEAAERKGVTERILTSLDITFDGLDWRQLTSHYLRRSHEHGARRVAEMKQSAETLDRLGVPPIMSRAIATTIASGHQRLAETNYDPAETYQQVLPLLATRPTGTTSGDPT